MGGGELRLHCLDFCFQYVLIGDLLYYFTFSPEKLLARAFCFMATNEDIFYTQ